MSLFPWDDDMAAEMHRDASEILRARRAVPAIKTHKHRNDLKKALAAKESDFIGAMIAHGKGRHTWPDGLSVEIYEEPNPAHREALPPKLRVFTAT
jgi:hypothetical protein